MQTRKKITARFGSQEHASPRFCRQQRKVTVIAESKVKELITSAKKQKSAGIHSNKIKDVEEAKNLNNTFGMAHDDTHDLCVAYEASLDQKSSVERPAQCVSGTIFSPAYHLSKDVCGAIPDKVDFVNFCVINDHASQPVVEESKADVLICHGSFEGHQSEKTEITFAHPCDRNADSTKRPSVTSDMTNNDACILQDESNHANKSCDDKYSVVANLSSEVSAIYLAMQHSKLECVDEQSQESISTEGCVEPDDSDECDDFDPYTFIKDLPDLSSVVPKFRPVLLPKQTRSCPSTTLVLDLDETLVHSSLEPCQDADFTFPVNFNLKEHTIYVRCRPYLKDFMERVAGLFETTIFTASQSIYAEQLLNILDPKRKLFRHRVYRESYVYVEGNYLKDLSILGRDLSHVIIIDNSPQAFGFQIDNGIPIESWFDDWSDKALLSLLPFLETLVGVDDVRLMIAKEFNLCQKVTAASCLSIDFKR